GEAELDGRWRATGLGELGECGRDRQSGGGSEECGGADEVAAGDRHGFLRGQKPPSFLMLLFGTTEVVARRLLRAPLKAYAYRYESCEVLKVLGGLDLRLPSLFVVTVPELHGFGIILDFAVRRIEVKFAVDEPGDVGELKHGDSDVANGDWGVELLAFAD